MPWTPLAIAYPDWVSNLVSPGAVYPTLDDRMGLAIALARENVIRGTGGPFGAAVFEQDMGRVVAVGMNLVVSLNNSALHAEIVALMMAQQRVGSYTLTADALPAHELVTSCDPCAMCLGATLWSGVKRLVTGASREDAATLSFDEGPVFPESYAYLRSRGLEVLQDVRREEARAVLALYQRQGGVVYNG